MNIVYSSSDYYAECTGVSLWGLYQNNKDVIDLDVYILSTDISEQNLERLQSVAREFDRKLTIISAKDDFVKGSEKLGLSLMRGSLNTYARVLLNIWFKNIDKVIVIDSDTIVTGSLSELWDYDMGDYIIGAVPDLAMYCKNCNIEDKELVENVETYFNMGICIVNLENWRKHGIDSYIQRRVESGKHKFRTADQSLINRFLNNHIMRIHLKYNYFTPVHNIELKTIDRVFCLKKVFYEKEYEEAKKETSIIHYYGHPFERPWYKHNAAYKKEEYKKVRSETPWATEELKKWPKEDNKVLFLYDLVCYCMLKLGMRSLCLQLRFIIGQKVKGKRDNNR